MKEISLDNFKQLHAQAEWEGGISALIDHGGYRSEVKGTTLEPLFAAAADALRALEKEWNRLESKFGEDLYE